LARNHKTSFRYFSKCQLRSLVGAVQALWLRSAGGPWEPQQPGGRSLGWRSVVIGRSQPRLCSCICRVVKSRFYRIDSCEFIRPTTLEIRCIKSRHHATRNNRSDD
jgi:hypothetical protein